MITPKKTAREADIIITDIIEIIPRDFEKILSKHKKKGKIRTIDKESSFVSQWNPVGGDEFTKKNKLSFPLIGWWVFPNIVEISEYLDIGIWKDVKDSIKAMAIWAINTYFNALINLRYLKKSLE